MALGSPGGVGSACDGGNGAACVSCVRPCQRQRRVFIAIRIYPDDHRTDIDRQPPTITPATARLDRTPRPASNPLTLALKKRSISERSNRPSESLSISTNRLCALRTFMTSTSDQVVSGGVRLSDKHGVDSDSDAREVAAPAALPCLTEQQRGTSRDIGARAAVSGGWWDRGGVTTVVARRGGRSGGGGGGGGES